MAYSAARVVKVIRGQPLKVWHEKNGWRGGRAGKDGDQVTVKADERTDLGDLALNP
jgi:hypothetical protein